jgi:DNA primase
VEHYMGRAHPFPSLLGDILLERYTVSEKLAKRTGGTFKKDRNPVLTAKSTMRHLRYEFLKRKRIEITEQMNTLDSIKKSRLSGIQQKLQKEISRIEKISPDDLFEDPEFMKADTASSTKKFEYKMKHEK